MILFNPELPILPQPPRNKNPEATTPSAIWASAKEAQTVVDPEAVTAQEPEGPARHSLSITWFRFLSMGVDELRLLSRDDIRVLADHPSLRSGVTDLVRHATNSANRLPRSRKLRN